MNAANTLIVADLTRSLVKLEDLDRATSTAGFTVCRRCSSISVVDALQSHADHCPYAVLARLTG